MAVKCKPKLPYRESEYFCRENPGQCTAVIHCTPGATVSVDACHCVVGACASEQSVRDGCAWLKHEVSVHHSQWRALCHTVTRHVVWYLYKCGKFIRLFMLFSKTMHCFPFLSLCQIF